MTKKDRKFRAQGGNNIPPQHAMTGGAFAQEIAASLRREYGGTHRATKTVVGLTGANARTVRNWLEGRNGPSGAFLVQLCRCSDQVLETVLTLAGRSDVVSAGTYLSLKARVKVLLAELAALYERLEKP